VVEFTILLLLVVGIQRKIAADLAVDLVVAQDLVLVLVALMTIKEQNGRMRLIGFIILWKI